jgi:hypothetical protein
MTCWPEGKMAIWSRVRTKITWLAGLGVSGVMLAEYPLLDASWEAATYGAADMVPGAGAGTAHGTALALG